LFFFFPNLKRQKTSLDTGAAVFSGVWLNGQMSGRGTVETTGMVLTGTLQVIILCFVNKKQLKLEQG
jgi:hypothetical protein